MPGESEHLKGADGAQRAKRWLELTTRVNVHWVNPDPIAVKKLSFSMPNGSSFSYDIGGVMRGGDLESSEFFAEVKKYKDAADQPTMYDEFLAKSYRAYSIRPERCDNFMWITWAPFSATSWSKHTSIEKIKAATEKYPKYNFLAEDEKYEILINDDTVKAVSERLWIIVLSDKQVENLSMSDSDLGIIRMHESGNGGKL